MNETTKESKFLDAINKYAEKQKSLISHEVEEYKAQKIEQATESGLRDAYELIQRDIAERKAAIVTEYARKEYQLRRELYAERQRITDEVFDAVMQKLCIYTATDAYLDSVRISAKKAASLCGGAPCVIYLRATDITILEEIKAFFADTELRSDPSIAIGGVRVLCEQKGVLIDDTLDTKLNDQRRWFAEHSGLKVV